MVEKTKKYYIIVQRGHEGLEKIFFVCTDEDIATNKAKELKSKAKLIDDYDILDNLSPKEHAKAHEYNYKSDDICVLSWNDKLNEYYCVCSQLGVPPSVNKLY